MPKDGTMTLSPGEEMFASHPPYKTHSDSSESEGWKSFLIPENDIEICFGAYEEFYRLWTSKIRPGHDLPRREDFDIFDLKPWLGNICLFDYFYNPFDVKIRLWGTNVAQWWGGDFTGKSLRELSLNASGAFSMLDHFAHISAQRRPGVISGNLELVGKKHKRVSCLDLPLEKNGIVAQALTLTGVMDSGADIHERSEGAAAFQQSPAPGPLICRG